MINDKLVLGGRGEYLKLFYYYLMIKGKYVYGVYKYTYNDHALLKSKKFKRVFLLSRLGCVHLYSNFERKNCERN